MSSRHGPECLALSDSTPSGLDARRQHIRQCSNGRFFQVRGSSRTLDASEKIQLATHEGGPAALDRTVSVSSDSVCYLQPLKADPTDGARNGRSG